MVVMVQVSDGSYDKISKQLDAMMDELMGPQFTRLVSTDAWEPQWNIYELSDRHLICVDLAGVHHEKIDLHVDRGTLRLSGYRGKPEIDDSNEIPSVHVIEIDWGRFERSMTIPDGVDAANISATYRNGYLWILLPKKSTSQGSTSP